MVSLSYMQSMSILRQIACDLVDSQQGVYIGKIINRGAVSTDSGNIIWLFPGLVRHEYPRGKTPKQANSFINRFMAVKGEFPLSEFQAMGWVHPSQRKWWTRLASYVTKQLRESLLQLGLYSAVRAVQHGIPHSLTIFFAMLELYNPDTLLSTKCMKFLDCRWVSCLMKSMSLVQRSFTFLRKKAHKFTKLTGS